MAAVFYFKASLLRNFTIWMTNWILLFLNLGAGEIFFIVLFILLFFGADKLPEIARGLGRGIREMKNATAEIQREIEKGATEIKRDINIGNEIDELNNAADQLKNNIMEGIHAEPEKQQSEPVKEVSEKENTPLSDEKTEIEEEHPLMPPGSVKRKG